MTSVIDHPHTEQHSGEYESLASRRHQLLDRTNWRVLLYDYAQPPLADDDEYNRGMADVPTLLHALAEDSGDPAAMQEVKRQLGALYEEFDHLGYIRHTPPEVHGRHATRPPADIAAHIDQWLRHTNTSKLYMRGSRYEQARATLPIQRLQTLMGVANLSSDLPPQIEAGLWAASQRIMDDYEEGIDAEHHNAHYNIALQGGEHLKAYDILAPEVTARIANAQHSYPAELMRGLETVHARTDASYYYANGVRHSHLGTITFDEHRMDLYLPRINESANSSAQNNQQSSRERILEVIDETLVHEFAHLAHTNAPAKWLLRWEELNKQRRVSVSDYAEYAHRTHEDNGRAEDFAEIARVYHRDPLRLLHLSPDHFRLMDELLQSYDDESVRAAFTLVSPTIHSTPAAYDAIGRQLQIARQRTIERRTAQAITPGAHLGRVGLHLAEENEEPESPYRLAA